MGDLRGGIKASWVPPAVAPGRGAETQYLRRRRHVGLIRSPCRHHGPRETGIMKKTPASQIPRRTRQLTMDQLTSVIGGTDGTIIVENAWAHPDGIQGSGK